MSLAEFLAWQERQEPRHERFHRRRIDAGVGHNRKSVWVGQHFGEVPDQAFTDVQGPRCFWFSAKSWMAGITLAWPSHDSWCGRRIKYVNIFGARYDIGLSRVVNCPLEAEALSHELQDYSP
jgi:hypothetical protein